MQSSMSDVKAWATAKMPKLNDNKTELMLVISKKPKDSCQCRKQNRLFVFALLQQYCTIMFHPYDKNPTHSRNAYTSSYTMPFIRPAQSMATLGDRSFYFTSFYVLNSIPSDVWCAPSLTSSKFRLKTFLFRSVYTKTKRSL